MAGAKAAHINQRELLAWFDKQERKPFSKVSSVNPTVKKIDLLYTWHRKDAFPNLDRIVQLYDRGTPPPPPSPNKVILGKGKEHKPGGLLKGFQNLLCLKC